MYSEKVMDHFRNPRNMGEIPDADGVGTVGNPVCGDLMTIYIKVKDKKLDDVKFKTFGCGAAIATSSMLDGLPPVKMHCSNLAADGLHEAINNYLEKKEAKE